MLNKAMIIGHLGQDPEVRYTKNGDAVASLSVATSERWKDKATGEQKEHTEWHRVTAWGSLAEIMGKYLHKGSKVYIEGKLQTRKWQDKEGNDRYTTEIRADQLKMLDGKEDRQPARNDRREQAGQPTRNAARPSFDASDDDVPFANPYKGKISLAI